ncbi:hypothetical protein EHQ47_05035 [Leptospira bourretii]|uniref:WD40 repeat domain-containing protein n=1 Tax=Leptospira bourretii TaxID=2484962 RepID=UPI00109121C2|nr:hypothetical protein [Leptospira bourretii]TGL23757.1 hypothetical protein EHQ47_05035 [Leptospira bourretii]
MKKKLYILILVMLIFCCHNDSLNEFKWNWHGISTLSLINSQTLLAGSRDGGLLIWHFNTGESENISTENKGIYASFSFGLIAFVDNKKNLCILSLNDFTIKSRLKTKSFANSIAFVHDLLVLDQSGQGPLLYRVKSNGSKIYPVALMQQREIEESHGVALHAQSDHIASGVIFRGSGLFNPEYGLSVWKTGGKLLWQKGGLKGLINGLEFSKDGKLIVSADKAGWLKVWRVADGKVLSEKRHTRGFTAVKFLSDGKHVVTGDFNGDLILWSLDSLEQERIIPTQQKIYMPLYMLENDQVVTGGTDGLLKITDLNPKASQKPKKSL